MIEWDPAIARKSGFIGGISELFSKIWNRQPNENEDGLWLFGREEDGDYFDDEDAHSWQNGRFEQSWFSDKLLHNAASRKVIDEIVKNREPYVDLACGPGMGLVPSIKRIRRIEYEQIVFKTK